MRELAFPAGVSFLVGYLIGGIPFAYVLARLRGVDLRAFGSGNIGATNLGRALGRKSGVFCLLLDVAKGFVPVLFLAPAIADRLGPAPRDARALLQCASVAMGLGAILGHVFTPYLRLRGGKGVATSIGVFAALLHWWMAMPLACYVAFRKATGYVSAGSLALAVTLPVAAFVFKRNELAHAWPTVAFAAAAGALIMLRHRENIARLLGGKELAAADGGREEGGRGERGDEVAEADEADDPPAADGGEGPS